MGLSSTEKALERLWAFLWENFPAEHAALEPVATPKPVATVNVAMKLLVALHGVGGLPIRYTTSGTRRHLLAISKGDIPDAKPGSRRPKNHDGPLTLCGYPAYTLGELVAAGVLTTAEARKRRNADICGACRLHERKAHPVTDDAMRQAAARLRRVAADLVVSE